MPLAAEDGLFVQGRAGEVLEDAVEVLEAEVMQLVVAGQVAGLLGRGGVEFEVFHRYAPKKLSAFSF
jgi:hypothetical protein